MSKGLQRARELLAELRAGLVEQDRLREEYEVARRQREEIQRRLAEQRRQLLASL
jgi:hypothetical protein